VSSSSAPSRPRFPVATRRADDPRVLLLYCHPNAGRSRVNRVLRQAVSDLDGVTIHDLYEAYPDQHIDVPFEQELLLAHHTVVMQSPFYWYSTPPLLKAWMDLVLTWGWAYGRGGIHLRGKRMMNALTTGGADRSYAPEGHNRFTLRQLLAPLDQTAALCGMEYLPPFVVHGTHRLDPDGITRAARSYLTVVEALRDPDLPLDRLRGLERINDDLSWVVREAAPLGSTS
jgi:glutathione-regulated potassium-efflux system ancillary protein KefG